MWELLQYRHRAWKYRLARDRAEIACAMDSILPGATVVDVGAHKGAYLYWLRRAAGPTGKVLAFEPQPQLSSYLERIAQQSRWKNVRVENLALSARPGVLPLHIPAAEGRTSPGARLGRKHAEDRGRCNTSFDVPVTTLDAYLYDTGISRVDFLKVDAEGHELAVFQGAERTLRTWRPTILFECEGRLRDDGDVRPVFEFLLELGYVGEYLDSATGIRLPLELFDPAIHQVYDSDDAYKRPGYCNNFLFTGSAASALRRVA
ncbi:MAG TPA: FkbM family methyltransferase [Pirellulaceae bacterium]|jgi:FkbM family methyltransferase|nr:FkbM family methyltransferase [Pirellulaceae bacterium]